MNIHTPDMSLPAPILEATDSQLPPPVYVPDQRSFSVPIPEGIMQVAMGGRHRVESQQDQGNGQREDNRQEALNSLDNAERRRQILEQVTGPVRLDFMSIRGIAAARFA